MNNKSKKMIALFGAVLMTAGTFAQQGAEAGQSDAGKTMVLTVEQAVEYAEKNNRTLKSNVLDLEMKERASKYGWNVLLPTVQATGTMARTNSDSTWSSIVSGVGTAAAAAYGDWAYYNNAEALAKQAGFENNESMHWAAVGSFGVSWNFSLAYIAQIKSAKVNYEAGKLSWEQSQRETLTNVKKLFYGLLIQQEALKIQKATLQNAKQRADQAQTNFNNGLVPELGLLQAQVNYENSKPDVDKAEQSLRQQLDTFAFLLGLPVGTKIELEGNIEPSYIEVTTEELLNKYGSNSLQIRSLESSRRVAKLGLTALDFSSYFPALAFSYTYQPTLAPYALDFDKWGDGDNWKDGGSLSLTLAWNITNMLPWSANRQKAADVRAQLAQLDLTIETLKENQKIEVRKAVDTLNQARDQIDAMGRNIKLAQRAYEMSARSYRNGTTELLDLRDSENQLNQAKLGQLNSKFNYLSALMDLENTLNTDLSAYKSAKAN